MPTNTTLNVRLPLNEDKKHQTALHRFRLEQTRVLSPLSGGEDDVRREKERESKALRGSFWVKSYTNLLLARQMGRLGRVEDREEI
jgi:hypothetical protein